MDNTFSTGIPDLDVALGPHLAPGNLIICTGLTGGGKTILAGQLAATMAIAGQKVLFVSTEVPEEELDVRILSAFCDIPYEEIKDGVKAIAYGNVLENLTTFPSPDRYGIDAYAKAVRIREPLVRNFVYREVRTFGFEPQVVIGEIFSEYTSRAGQMPGVVICDHLSLPKVTREDMNIFKEREAAVEAAKVFASLARDRHVLVVVFCQADQALTDKKKITSENIYDFHSVRKSADAFIGISNRLRSDEAMDDGGGVHERIQHLTVETTLKPEPMLVPVIRAFEYQRFESFHGRVLEPKGEETENDEIARRIEATSEYAGYVLARRKRFLEIFSWGIPNAINLYAFLLLTGGRNGVSNYGRDKQSMMLGLTVKQLRTALAHLEENKFVTVSPPVVKRSLWVTLARWQEDQKPGEKGYFKLFRNLRDESRRDLLADPVLFRVWLYVLNEARQFGEEAADLLPGEVLVRPRVAEEILSLKAGELAESLNRLQERGSILYHDGAAKLSVTNWRLYQKVMYPSTRGVGGCKSAEN